jgi:hypothetical protein
VLIFLFLCSFLKFELTPPPEAARFDKLEEKVAKIAAVMRAQQTEIETALTPRKAKRSEAAAHSHTTDAGAEAKAAEAEAAPKVARAHAAAAAHAAAVAAALRSDATEDAATPQLAEGPDDLSQKYLKELEDLRQSKLGDVKKGIDGQIANDREEAKGRERTQQMKMKTCVLVSEGGGADPRRMCAGEAGNKFFFFLFSRGFPPPPPRSRCTPEV